MPLILGALVLATFARPHLLRGWAPIDGAILAALAVMACQLIPLSAALREALSPGAVAFDRVMRLGDPREITAGPLSIDAGATALALLLALSLVLVFWSARTIFRRTGLRITCRSIAWMGIAASAIAIVQRAAAPGLIYGYFHPLSSSARPFGPFVDRNHFATWVVMAIPLTTGYAIARIRSRHRSDGGPLDLESAVDDTEVWLLGAVLLMAVALVVSASRSGAIGAAAALCTLVWLARNKTAARGRMWLVGTLATIAVVAFAYTSTDELVSRLGEVTSTGLGGRAVIWRETLPMVSAFRLTGIGAGAYERGMLLYQQSPRLFYFNHAHDEYLQIAAEGGLLLSIPVALALCAGLWRGFRRAAADYSAVFWIRAGALGGIVGVLVQNVWDTGLRMPANGLLFAVACAIALHEPHAPGEAPARRPWRRSPEGRQPEGRSVTGA